MGGTFGYGPQFIGGGFVADGGRSGAFDRGSSSPWLADGCGATRCDRPLEADDEEPADDEDTPSRVLRGDRWSYAFETAGCRFPDDGNERSCVLSAVQMPLSRSFGLRLTLRRMGNVSGRLRFSGRITSCFTGVGGGSAWLLDEGIAAFS